MGIVGVNFDKISAEKTGILKAPLNINQNLNIVKLEKDTTPFSDAQEVIKFYFEFNVNYQDKIGNLDIGGHVIYVEDKKEITKILDDWSKEKKINTELSTLILNTALVKCSITGLNMTQNVNLPPHIPLPKLKAAPKAQKQKN
jgi:hypothetical protein